jgi:hypothetical protein
LNFFKTITTRVAGEDMKKFWITLGASTFLAACAAAPPAQHLRFANPPVGAAQIDWTKPIVLEFQPGDRLPVHAAFSNQLFELSPASPAIELVAKRHGFVRIDGAHITTSLTGDDFEAKPLAPGMFRFGLVMTREGTWVDLALTTPRKAEPTAAAPAPTP